jgi:hypothetical protein
MNLPTNFSTVGLPFMLVMSSQSWVNRYGNAGVLGLGRNSSFWNYLISQYRRSDDDTFSISILYHVRNASVMLLPQQIELENAFFTINGRAGENHLFTLKPLESAASNWLIPAANVTVFTNVTYLDKPICIDDSKNHYFFFEDNFYQSLLRQFNLQLCGDENACTKKSSNPFNCTGIKIAIFDGTSTLEIEVPATDLVSFDASGNAFYGFSVLGSSECAKDDAIFGVGKWFFTKTELTIRVNSKLEFMLGLSLLSSSEKKTSILLFIFITIMSLVLFGVTIVLCINFLPNLCKKKDSPDVDDQKEPLKSAGRK